MRYDVEIIQKQVEVLKDTVEGLDPALGVNIPELFRMDDRSWEEFNIALQILEDHVPLAEHYPDGSLTRSPYTYRQVLLLARTAGYVDPITHREQVYQDILADVREELGRRRRVRCSSLTMSGKPCKSFALAYSDDGESKCSSHANSAQSAFNKKMRSKEEEMLKQRLDDYREDTNTAPF